MLPERDLPLRLLDDRAYVEWLGVQDEPWLRVLVGEMVRFEGRRRRELGERLAEPLPCDAPYLKRRAATRVLLRMWNPPARTGGGGVRPVVVREALFGAAVACNDRAVVVGEVAARLGMTAEAIGKTLFADLPGEREVRAPDPIPGVREIVLQTNLALTQPW